MTTTKTTTKTTAVSSNHRDLTSEIGFLTRALKAPTMREAVARLAERARAESWTHEEFLVACLQREVSARESHGGEGRIRAARFPSRKSLEEFDFDHARGLKRDTIAHLGTLDFVVAKDNVVFLGPPGTGKTHLAIGIAIRACQAGHRVLFATASEWVARLAEAHHSGRLQQELIRLGRYPLLVIDEVGYIPFEPEAANLFFQLVSSRYERASLIVTSNKPFGPLGRSIRRRRCGRCHDRPPGPPRRSHRSQRRLLPHRRPRPQESPGIDHRRMNTKGVNFQPTKRGQFSTVVDRAQGRFKRPLSTRYYPERVESDPSTSSWASSPGRRHNMQANRSRDTKPELDVRRGLHRLGLRYRVGIAPEPAVRRRADIVFTRARVAVFIDGCFWHGCPEHGRSTFNHNAHYWSAKIAANAARDAETNVRLRDAGWIVLRFWEHEDVAEVVENVRCAVLRPRFPR